MSYFIKAIFIYLFVVNFQLLGVNYEIIDLKSQMLRDIDMIEHLFGVSYAPVEWKRDRFGLDLDAELQRMRNRVETDRGMTLKQYQQMVKELTFALKDYHVTVNFFSTEYASLPFNIQSAEGRYFITKVYTDQYCSNKGKTCLAEGDEVLSINGKPVKQVFEEFKKREIGDNVKETDQCLAELYMTRRMGSMGHVVPKGEMTFDLMKKGAKKSYTIKAKWNYTEESVSPPKFAKAMRVAGKKIDRVKSMDKLFMSSHYLHLKKMEKGPSAELEYFGAKQGVLPLLGEVEWKSAEESYFDAYLFNLPGGKRAGYLRIASYLVLDIDKAVADFEEIINKFEAEAEVLVIDQMNNPGGYVFYLYALASRLTPYTLLVPKHRITLTQGEIYNAVNEMEYLDSLATEEEEGEYFKERLEGIWVSKGMPGKMKKFFEKLISCWNSGGRLTDFVSLYGIDVLDPHPTVHYTKPILMLINSLDFSGGDFMPAIMQDNSRAVLMGSRTAGAGGYIEDLTYPNLCGVEGFNVTGSFAVRANNEPIENLGVEPDIRYNVSIDDLVDKYADYKKRILEELIRLAR